MIDYRCSPYNAPVDGVWLAIGVLLFNRPLNYSLPINEHWSTANPRTQTFYAAEIANTCWFSGSPQSTIQAIRKVLCSTPNICDTWLYDFKTVCYQQDYGKYILTTVKSSFFNHYKHINF